MQEHMDLNEKRAYGRGYNAGIRHRWQEHKPPIPPDEIVASIICAANRLRDAVDGELAKFGEDDPIEEILGPRIEELDEAMRAMGVWLLTDEEKAQEVCAKHRAGVL